MATPLAGLSGLYGPRDPEAHGRTGRDPSMWGVPADPRHAIPGDSALGDYHYHGTAYGPTDPAIVGDDPAPETGAGEVFDHTPNVHSAPYPNGVEQDPCVWSMASTELHGYDLGGTRLVEHAAVPDQQHIVSGIYPSPQDSVLAPGTPAQIRGGEAGLDVDQGDGVANTGTFAIGHEFFLRTTNPIPRNWSTVNGGERPFYGAHPSAWQARFDGDDSAYGAQGDTSVAMNMAPTPVGYPTPYQSPADPTIAAQIGYGSESPMSDYDWVAG